MMSEMNDDNGKIEQNVVGTLDNFGGQEIPSTPPVAQTVSATTAQSPAEDDPVADEAANDEPGPAARRKSDDASNNDKYVHV